MGASEHTDRQEDSAPGDDRAVSARAHLRVVHGRSPSAVKAITAAGLTVGRGNGGRDADLVLEDPRMSRRHIRVEPGVLGWVLADTESRNGGFVHGRAFAPGARVALVDGAVIRLGDSLLVFRASSPGEGDDDSTSSFPGPSPLAAAVRDRLRRLIAATGHVVILGETGTGKEHAARFIAEASGAGRFVPVNCAELTRELARSELFGHVRGAFSGAQTTKVGLIDAAASGVLFLDEIGDLPLDVQGDLLRFLDDGSYRPVGSTELRRSAARIVAATNADLDDAVRAGRFRRDLLARLRASNTPLELPPLRKRPEDILGWTRRFALELDPSGAVELFGAGAAECLLLYSWPENLRELRGVVRSVLAARPQGPIAPEVLPDRLRAHRKGLRAGAGHARAGSVPSAGEPTRDEIAAALGQTKGRMLTAAQRLGIDRRKLYRLCERLGLDVESFRRGGKPGDHVDT
jgi:DNA-binding NtrC family response regulator